MFKVVRHLQDEGNLARGYCLLVPDETARPFPSYSPGVKDFVTLLRLNDTEAPQYPGKLYGKAVSTRGVHLNAVKGLLKVWFDLTCNVLAVCPAVNPETKVNFLT
ncbi:MAG TPA: hypothetical protein VLA04_05310 [Verrucomicrobiae bacterium]|nr:hypothetical protein [Verrucomicrobiae bacterium]